MCGEVHYGMEHTLPITGATVFICNANSHDRYVDPSWRDQLICLPVENQTQLINKSRYRYLLMACCYAPAWKKMGRVPTLSELRLESRYGGSGAMPAVAEPTFKFIGFSSIELIGCN
jgi:hypothetical protein